MNVGGQVTFLGSFPDELPVTGLPEVAFAGRSNVGKSSALNCLMDQKRAARVSSTPGRTQTINLFQIRDRLVFADLPGYGYAKVPGYVQEQWKPMSEGYLGTRAALRLVVVLVDVRLPPVDLDVALLEGLQHAGVPAQVVGTKCDKLKRRALDKAVAALRKHPLYASVLPFSSQDRTGRDALWRRLSDAIASPERSAAELG